MLFRRLLFLCLFNCLPGCAATVLVLPFHNSSTYPELAWVGESIAETLSNEFATAGEIVLERAARADGMRRLSLRPDAAFTKATLIKLGQAVDADYVCYGSYTVQLPNSGAQLRASSVQVSAGFLDLRKFHEGPDLTETAKLADLSQLEEHLAWQALKYLQPQHTRTEDAFVTPDKFIRLEAKESYGRGILSQNKNQQAQWFVQAAALDNRFSSPTFELGRIAFERKDYRQAIAQFEKIKDGDPRYAKARFSLGLCAYYLSNYPGAIAYLRGLSTICPSNEVYNNLGAAESQLGDATSIDDFRHVVGADSNDPVYLFNLGAALLKNDHFDEATRRLQAAVDRNTEDEEAVRLLGRARERLSSPPGQKPLAPPRLKVNFNETAFRASQDKPGNADQD